MLADFLAATATPTPMPAAVHDAYDWWSDIWLPAVVGFGSVFIAFVAVRVARRSNRLASAATKAAERSNAIAKRSLAHEEQQAKRARDESKIEERRDYAKRFLGAIDLLADELAADPSSWDTPVGSSKGISNSLKLFGPLIMEAVALGYDNFPEEKSMALLKEASGAPYPISHIQRARAAVRAIVTFWTKDPESVNWTVESFTRIFRQGLN